MSDIVLGIDLGTTNSLVAYMKDNVPEIIENESGDRFTRSSVYFFEPNKRGVGADPSNMDSNFQVNHIKRLIGKKYEDIKDEIETYFFGIEEKNKMPIIKLNHPNGEIEHTPVEISSMVLGYIVENAKTRLGTENINNVVITVPAYFDQKQRQATKEAATLAGLNVVQFLNEPTAAALYHIFYNPSDNKRRILVFDLGGGTFDMSILEAEGFKVTTVGTDGINTLGGKDFDDLLYSYVVQLLEKEHSFVASKESNRVLDRLKNKCIKAKHDVNAGENCLAILTLDDLGFASSDDLPDEITLTLDMFNEATKKLCDQIKTKLDQFLKAKKLSPDDFDEVLLIGGSTRLIQVHEILTKMFKPSSIKKTVNPDEAVALGAAIYAMNVSRTLKLDDTDLQNLEDNLNENEDKIIPIYAIKEALSFSLGVEILGGQMSVLNKKDSALPSKVNRTYVTTYDDQDTIHIKVFEGEEKLTKDNGYLGILVLDDITPMPKGKVSIKVTFDVDLNGILNITAFDNYKKTERKHVLNINKS